MTQQQAPGVSTALPPSQQLSYSVTKFVAICASVARLILAVGAAIVLVAASMWLWGHMYAPAAISSAETVGSDFTKPTIISQDATRRIIVLAERPATPGIPGVPEHMPTPARDGVPETPFIPAIPGIDGTPAALVACTEPSPDALSAISASVAATGGLSDQAAAALEAGLKQSVAGIGLRTQSIQMLRDQGFRICEGYATGALDKLDYRQLLRRSQVFTAAILAIEQLTSAVKAQQVTVGVDGTNSGDFGKSALVEQAQNLILRQQELDKAIKENGEIAKANAGDMVAGKVVDAGAIAAAADKIRVAQEAVNKALASISTLSGQMTVADTKPSPTESASIVAGANAQFGDVAGAVQKIVLAAFSKTFMTDFCQMYYGRTLAPVEAMGDECMSRERRNLIENACLAAFDHEFKTALAVYNLEEAVLQALVTTQTTQQPVTPPPGVER